METNKPKDTDGSSKRPVKVYLDRDIFRLVRIDHVERDIPVSHVVEEILARHYNCKPRIGA